MAAFENVARLVRVGTVKRTAALNGGSASDPGRSRIGDRCALITGR